MNRSKIKFYGADGNPIEPFSKENKPTTEDITGLPEKYSAIGHNHLGEYLPLTGGEVSGNILAKAFKGNLTSKSNPLDANYSEFTERISGTVASVEELEPTTDTGKVLVENDFFALGAYNKGLKPSVGKAVDQIGLTYNDKSINWGWVTNGDIVAGETMELISIVVKKATRISLYVSMANSSFNSDRAGVISLTKNGVSLQTIMVSARASVYVLSYEALAGDQLIVSLRNDSTSNARLWLFGWSFWTPPSTDGLLAFPTDAATKNSPGKGVIYHYQNGAEATQIWTDGQQIQVRYLNSLGDWAEWKKNTVDPADIEIPVPEVQASPGMYVTSSTLTSSATSLSEKSVTVPSGFTLKVGDLILAANGNLFLITALASGVATISYRMCLKGDKGDKGATGATGPAGSSTGGSGADDYLRSMINVGTEWLTFKVPYSPSYTRLGVKFVMEDAQGCEWEIAKFKKDEATLPAAKIVGDNWVFDSTGQSGVGEYGFEEYSKVKINRNGILNTVNGFAKMFQMALKIYPKGSTSEAETVYLVAAANYDTYYTIYGKDGGTNPISEADLKSIFSRLFIFSGKTYNSNYQILTIDKNFLYSSSYTDGPGISLITNWISSSASGRREITYPYTKYDFRISIMEMQDITSD